MADQTPLELFEKVVTRECEVCLWHGDCEGYECDFEVQDLVASKIRAALEKGDKDGK